MPTLDRIFHWIRGASPSRWFWLGGPMLLYCWSLTGPFLSDDLNLLLKSERYQRGESAAPELYRFAKSDKQWNELRGRGTVPWWLPERGRLDFMRPVSDWTFYWTFRLFGRGVLGHRLVSLGLFVVVLHVVHWTFRQAGADAIRAGAATFFFGISQTATPPVTWMCNRQDLLVALGVAIAAGAYWRSWTRPGAVLVVIAAAAYAFALLSKEMAVPLAAIVVVHEIMARRRRETRWARPYTGLVAVGLAAVAAVYLAYYLYSRPWVTGMNGAEDNAGQPLSRWPISLLLYLTVWTIGFPIDVLLTATDVEKFTVMAIGGLMAVVLLYYLRRSVRGDRAAPFFALWAILFMLPGLYALTASTRTLCVASIGWAWLLVGLILPSREEDVVIPSPLRHWYYTVNGIVSVGCAIGTVLYMNSAEMSSQGRMRRMVAACSPPLAEGHALIVQSAESSAEAICSGDRLEYMTGLRNVAVTYLLTPDIDADVRIEDDRTLVLQARDRSLLGSALHKLTLPASWRPRTGQRFGLPDFTVEIVEVRGEDFVSALRLRFNTALNTPRLHFHPPALEALAKSVAGGPVAAAKGSRP